MKSDMLVGELDEVLTGTPWYGSPVIKLIDQVEPDKVHDRSCGPHSIADILIHMIAWTEETTKRLRGEFASEPLRGDWPNPQEYSWGELVQMFKTSNELLKAEIVRMDDDMFTKTVNDDRSPVAAEKGTYEDLIKGIIQHHIYHSAQIAILSK